MTVVKIVPMPGIPGPQGEPGTPGINATYTSAFYSPNFDTANNNLTYTGNPTANSKYIRIGDFVSFDIEVNCATVTSFGTGQFQLELPFMPAANTSNHFDAWAWVNPALPPDDLNGHIVLKADHLPDSTVLDLHWLGAATSNPKPVIEHLFSQGSPVTLITGSKIYVNGSYIAESEES